MRPRRDDVGAQGRDDVEPGQAARRDEGRDHRGEHGRADDDADLCHGDLIRADLVDPAQAQRDRHHRRADDQAYEHPRERG